MEEEMKRAEELIKARKEQSTAAPASVRQSVVILVYSSEPVSSACVVSVGHCDVCLTSQLSLAQSSKGGRRCLISPPVCVGHCG